MKSLMIAASCIILGILCFILIIILIKGIPSLSWEMISTVPGGGFYLGKEGGILNAVIGSLYLILGAVLMSLIISLPVVAYISFFIRKNSRFSGLIRFCFDMLFGIPSIVYGAFGFSLMIYLGMRASLLGGMITIAILILPIMVKTIDEIALTLPRDLLDIPKALGATPFETTMVAFRQLIPGTVTAVLLATGRGIGDAATVLFTAGYTDNIPTGLGQPAASLPLAIFFQLSSPVEEVQGRAYASALILTLLILFISFVTRRLGRKLSKFNL